MVAFRRWSFAFAAVTLLAGLASAQTPQTTFSCAAAVSVPPTLRAEGFTELIGDIVLTCSGGSSTAFVPGAPLPTANISVSLGTNVTSRLINGAVSEALLLIDEPGSGLTPVVGGAGPAAPQTVCSSASLGAGPGGCVQTAVFANPIVGGPQVPVMQSLASNGNLSNPANVYQGEWFAFAPNQIQFFGIPILPPVSSGTSRIYRITNIRANVSGFSGAALQGTQQLNASVSISGSTSVTVNTPFQTAGFVQTSLSVSTRNVNNSGGLSSSTSNFPQCGSENSVTAVGLLQYSENFGTAFKVRNTVPGTAPGTLVQTQGATLTQNIPGQIYNSESGFELATPNGTAGLADFGTRLQATFHNIPSGVRMFVSVNNVTNTSVSAAPNFAALVATGPYPSSATPDSSTTVSAGSVAGYPVIAPTTTAGGVSYVEIIPDSTGSAYAVWESVSNNPNALDSYQFVYAQLYSSTSGINSPPIPAGATSVVTTVNMSYAPIPPAGSSSSTIAAWALPSSSLPIPRFADTSTALNAFTISICQTVLLFPFVTNIDGFDTGIAISNTTSDPFGTKQQAGVCQLYAYGAIGQPTSQPACNNASTATGLFCMPGTGTTGYVIGTGTTSATLASAIAPGFEGYVIAVCNFQLAHGFAFVSDVGARNLAMGYLALIVNNGSIVRNVPAAESLGH